MPSPLVYFQIATTDVERSRAFFSELFDWQFGDGNTIDPGGPADFDPKGAFLEVADEARAGATLWFRVSDLWTTVDRAQALDATVLVPIRQTAGGAHVALIRTPEGLAVGIVQA